LKKAGLHRQQNAKLQMMLGSKEKLRPVHYARIITD